MNEKISLFEELKSGGYDTCLTTTFNIDFPFYEEVLLRRMRTSGVYHHMVFVDRKMCIQAIQDRPPRMAGQHYTLAPMACAHAFHPKVLLLLGRNKGFLAVGSHNITLSGYGQNLEITNAIRFRTKSNTQSLTLFQSAYKAFLTWTKDYGEDLPQDIKESVGKIKQLFPWLQSEEEQASPNLDLLFASTSTQSLWSQLQPFIPADVQKIRGASAYFDQSLGLIKQLQTLNPQSIHIGIQKDRVQAPAQLVSLDGVSVVESSFLSEKGKSQDYIHAKLLNFESTDQQVLISGSANLSAPAWLAQGENANAEAIIVRSDADTPSVIEELGLLELEQAIEISKLPEPEIRENDPAVGSLTLLMLPYRETTLIEIPLSPKWTEALTLGYETTYKQLKPIPFNINNGSIVIESKDIVPGEVIMLLSGGIAVARIILHNIKQMQKYTTTGIERKVQQALGSLGTDSPDIQNLFECINKLTSTEEKAPKHLGARSEKQTSDESGKEPTTLLTEISARKIDRQSGRARLPATGDIEVVMDAILHNLKSQIGSETRELNEDNQGRSEEDLIDADDETPDIPAPDADTSDTPTSEGNSNEPDLSSIAQAKLGSTIQKLGQYLSKKPANGASAALGVLILTHRLSILNNEEITFTTKPLLIGLFKVLVMHLLKDKDPFFTVAEEDSVFNSDEWGRVLGYITWLAYHADITLKQRLPLSASKEEKDNLRWANSCWLYLAQRISKDELARSEASRLVSSSGSEHMKFWLEAMTLFRSDKGAKAMLRSISGFDLATSPQGGFPGTRLVVNDKKERDIENETVLASISHPGGISRFRQPNTLDITLNST